MDTQNNLARIIVVSGEGKVSAQPDLATVNFSVISQGKKVKAVMDEGKEKMNNILGILEGLEIATKDIITSGYYFSPEYAYPRNKPPQIIGYRLEQQITVKIRNLALIDQVLDLTVEAGINRVGKLDFLIDEEGNLKKEARRKAFGDAYDKAQLMAEAAGVKLGRIITFAEGVFALSPEVLYGNMYPQTRAGAKGGAIFGGGLLSSTDSYQGPQSTSIATGSKEVIINVQVAYEIE